MGDRVNKQFNFHIRILLNLTYLFSLLSLKPLLMEHLGHPGKKGNLDQENR